MTDPDRPQSRLQSAGGLRAASAAAAPPVCDPPTAPEGRPDRVQIRERNRIWEVRVDGDFRGDYHQKDHAVAAAARFKREL